MRGDTGRSIATTLWSVTALADGRLAYCSGDKTVKVWDLSKPDEQQCGDIEGHTSCVISVTALADERLASCSFDKTVKVWDLSKPDEQQCVATLKGIPTVWVSHGIDRWAAGFLLC